MTTVKREIFACP